MSARQEILRRIRTATADLPASAGVPGAVPIPRGYRLAGQPHSARSAQSDQTDLVDLFTDRVQDYRATVRHCGPSDVSATIAATLTARGLRRILTPAGFPSDWLADFTDLAPGISLVGGGDDGSDAPLSIAELDRLDGVVTTCAVAIAATGTVILDHGPGQGHRAFTLVPDCHVAVVRSDQILFDVPEAIAALDPTRPMTWISGPSATSDIELSRVEGVHGPRTLEVIVVLDR